MLLSLLLSIAAAQAPPPSAPTAETEMLAIDAPDAFKVGYQARNRKMKIVEIVEPPESVNAWSRLVTGIVFFDAAHGDTIDGYYEKWRLGMRRTCPGIRDKAVAGTVDGFPALSARLSCPEHPETGKPETLTAILIRGQANMLIAQVAFRRPLKADDRALVKRVVRTLKVCDTRLPEWCDARKATGFVRRR